MSNYDKILRDKENNLPPKKSDLENNWALLETQLNSTSQTSTNEAKFNLNKIIKTLLVTAVVAIIIFIGFFVSKNKNTPAINTDFTLSKSAIKPPMPAVNVLYETFMYDADKGDTLFTKNGSILVFPKNAVLNNKGEIVSGKIELRTREFNDPLDYYMAGIPMTYDSAGVKYTFVSSGMIDIKAYKNNELLYVNPKAKPQLNLVSTNSEKNTNLYILDTTKGQWINKGKDEVNHVAIKENKSQATSATKTDFIKNTESEGNVISEKAKDEVNDVVIEKGKINTTTVQEDRITLKAKPRPKEANVKNTKNGAYEMDVKVKPIMPQKASGKNPTIEIIIDPASFKELLTYNNLKFEVLNSSVEALGEDSKTEWENVELVRNEEKNGYSARFTLGKKVVQYKVKPVLEGKNYDVAIKVYNEKVNEYYDLQKKRIAKEQMQNDTIALQDKLIDEENKKTVAKNEVVIAKNKIVEIENKRIEELNILIIARNKRVAEAKKEYLLMLKKQERSSDSLNKLLEERNRILRLVWEKENRALALKENLLRSFTIDGFGYWNCDMPTYPNGVPISATFIDDKNNILNLNYINAASFGINRVLAYYNNNITVLPNTKHIIWSVYQNEFYYLSFKEYEKLNIKPDRRAFTFKLNKYEGKSNTVSDLRKILYGG